MSTDDKKGFFDGPTRRVGGGASQQGGSGDDDFFGGKTRVVGEEKPSHDSSPEKVSSSTQDFSGKTRRVGPSSQSGDNASSPSFDQSTDQQPEFVVGWLVITEGPGRGLSKALGYGMNSIGRGDEALIRLDYGDEEISRNAHCHIAYDHKNKKFYIQHGGGQNLTYLGSDPVLSSSELSDKAEISIGKTTMTFIQLCNDSFDWEE